jgi:hypothetical protein
VTRPIAWLSLPASPHYDMSVVGEAETDPPTLGGASGPIAVRPDRRRAVAAAAVLLIALGGAAIAIDRERSAFVGSLRDLGPWAMVGSFCFGLIGVAATLPVWRAVLGGLDVELPWRTSATVFFTSQLGKYVPGSVWPVLIQMEAGHARGANRRTMLVANVATIVISCTVGLVLACILLPLHDGSALAHYWWALALLPLLLVLLHPRTMPALVDLACRVLRRPSLGGALDSRSVLRASGWSLVSWTALGAHLTILCIALGARDLATMAVCTGSMAMAYSLGVLFLPAPAGALIRDGVLVLALRVILPSGAALAAVVASRVILIACDLTLAGAVAVARHRLGWVS